MVYRVMGKRWGWISLDDSNLMVESLFSTERPVFEVRPVFRWKLSLLISCFLAGFATPFILGGLGFLFTALVLVVVIATLDFGKFDEYFGYLEGKNIESEQLAQLFMTATSLFPVVIFCVVARLIYRHLKRMNERTVYRFYRDRVEYVEGFRRLNFKSVSYKDILGVEFSQSNAQANLGLGDIMLTTADRYHRLLISNIEYAPDIVRFIQEAKRNDTQR